MMRVVPLAASMMRVAPHTASRMQVAACPCIQVGR